MSSPPSRPTSNKPATFRRKSAVALISLCVLAAGLATAATPAAGQDNSGIRIYDEHPDLHGPSSGWLRVNDPPGEYGLNHHGPYAYTYGNQDPTPTNWASWSFSVPDSSTYDVWIWVPANHATAQVNYKLHLTGCTHPLGIYPTVDQQNYIGWVQIGKVALDRISNSPSNNVFLEAIDNEVSDPYDSLLYRSIGVSVALLERDFNMGWEHQTNSNQLITDEGCYGSTPTQQPTPQPQRTVPSEPRNLTVTPGDRSLEVSWSPPANDGGSPITGYRATFWDESRGQGGGRTVSGTSATFTGLNNGTTYKVSVAAINRHGEGNRASTTSVPQGAGTVPSEPRNLTVTPGDRSLEVSWSPPANDGGSPITGYRVVWYSWDAGTSDRIGIAGTSYTIRGLTNDATYYVEVYAANRHGPGSKATGSGIPMGPPRCETGGRRRRPRRWPLLIGPLPVVRHPAHR